MKRAVKATLLLMTFRQQSYVVDALRSCLSQQGVLLEIIASDDASNDGTFEAMQADAEGYAGPHKLVVRCNESNMGMVPHLNLLMSMATGDIIVIAAGDDVSYPHRVAKLLELFDSSPDIYAIYSNAVCITSEGRRIGPLYKAGVAHRDRDWRRIAQEGTARITGCGLAWRREVFDRFGPLPIELQAEDQAIPFRAALLGRIAYLPEPLLDYRQGPASLTHWRRYRKAFLRLSLRDMRQLQQEMTVKNLGDALAMYHDLRQFDVMMGENQDALRELDRRIDQLRTEQAIFSNCSSASLLKSNTFRSAGWVSKFKLVLMACFPVVFLLAKGWLLLWRKGNVSDVYAKRDG